MGQEAGPGSAGHPNMRHDRAEFLSGSGISEPSLSFLSPFMYFMVSMITNSLEDGREFYPCQITMQPAADVLCLFKLK